MFAVWRVADDVDFAIVLEGIKKSVAEQITKAIKIPTIGIGASEKCDGQVLVLEDMLGLTEKAPKFVKIYDNLSKNVKAAVKKYNSEVKSKKFPAKENCYE